MTAELQETLEREMRDAQALEDPVRRREATETVQTHIMLALLDCQRKTADRVKELYEAEKIRKAEKAAKEGAASSASGEDNPWMKVALMLLKYGGWLIAIILTVLNVKLPT